MTPNTDSIFLVFTDATQYSLLEPLDTRQNNYIVAARGYSVDLNCQLNDPSVDVHLMQETKKSGKPFERARDGVKVTQSGQIFTINNIQESDKGTYHCKAESTVLKIEKLYLVTFGSTQGNRFVCNMLR